MNTKSTCKSSKALKTTVAVAALLALTIGLAALPATRAAAFSPTASIFSGTNTERYLHVKVEDSENGESVNVNLPLSFAEKILPTVNHGQLHHGRVTIHDMNVDGVDLRAILDALRATEDGEFITVKQKDEEVHVAKSKGDLIVHCTENKSDAKRGQKVEVTVPMKVVEALMSTMKDNELDVAAAVHALAEAGDAVLVTVQDASQHVRVWVDSHSGSSE